MGSPRRNVNQLINLINFVTLPRASSGVAPNCPGQNAFKKTFLHRKSGFPTPQKLDLQRRNIKLCGSPQVFLTQSKHATNQYKATSSSWLIHRTKLSFTSLNLTCPPRCLVCPRYNLCGITNQYSWGLKSNLQPKGAILCFVSHGGFPSHHGFQVKKLV